MSDNLTFLLTCAAECLNNWGYDGHGKHVDDGVKEIEHLRAENKMAFEAVVDVVKVNDELRSRIESAEEAYVRLDASMNRLKAAFRVNMLRAFPNMSHEEIDAEIEAAIRSDDD